MSSDDASDESYRTPLVLAIKTITTHAFALASYAYASSLLRRPTHTHIQVVRILFFAFVPTLPLVEILISFLRSLMQFLRNYEDDDAINIRFYLSAALGTHASLHKSDEETNKDVKDKKVSLLQVGSHCAEKDLIPMSWAWAGKILAALFGITQAVGTIVMWVRRMKTNGAKALSFDHRNGAMGIASAICGGICILTLLLRLKWRVSKAFEAPQKENGYFQNQRSQLVVEALLAMLLHLVIAALADKHNLWLYSSVGSVAFLFVGRSPVIIQGWQTLMLLIFLYIFRHDITRRLGLKPERYAEWFGGRRLYRVKALVGFLLMLWVVVDLIWLFVVDIIQVVREARYIWPGHMRGDLEYWWQDPLSDSLIVI